jgi:hypothetical protein
MVLLNFRRAILFAESKDPTIRISA